MISDIQKDMLWQLRQKQNLSELMPLYSELKIKFPEDQEIQCLEASLYRARGEIRKSQASLKSLRNSHKATGINPRIFMEEGLNFLYQGDSYQGLEKFLACYSLIKNIKSERLLAVQCLINAMISLDNLGQSYAYTEVEFNKLRMEMEIPAGYIATVNMLGLFGMFRAGNFKLIDEALVSHSGQAKFFKYYVGLLPYHKFHFPLLIANEIENMFTQESELYLKSYRLRTLQKCLHPEDEKNKKVSEVIDRLYLWTWQFILAPSESEWTRLIMTINHIEMLSRSHLSVDDSDKLVCSLGWLGLFDPVFEKSSEKLTALFRISEGVDQTKFHQLEKLIIHYLKAKLNNDKHVVADYFKILKSHPLYQSKDISLRNLIEFDNDNFYKNPLKSLIDNIQSLDVQKNNKINPGKIIIDLRNHKIMKSGTRDITSENMCMALSLLFKNEVISDTEFFSQVFGLDEFDPLIHNSKLFTILWRMKKILNEDIEFKVKNGMIYSVGNWKNVKFISLPLIIKIMRNKSPEFFKNYADSQTSKSLVNVEKIQTTTEFLLNVNETLSRAEIEKRIGKSRPTCNRMISKWRSLGFLDREGSGPATRYRISKNIECRGDHEI